MQGKNMNLKVLVIALDRNTEHESGGLSYKYECLGHAGIKTLNTN